jgi:hypothetical protein
MEHRDYSDYQASCAVCGRPADGECVSGCETDRLNLAIEQAEAQWLNKWREQTREWVAHNAVKYVTNSFASMKEARLATYVADLKTIPYYHIYEQYNGRPPVHPQYIAGIKRQIAQAEYELRRNIDSDWRSCVLRYPEVLAHFFSLVNVTLPKDVEAPNAIIPAFPAFPPQSPTTSSTKGARSTTGSATQKKARRVSLSTTTKTKDKEDQSLETIAKLLQSQNLSMGMPNGFPGMKMPASAKAGRGSPVYDNISKAGGKKRMTQEFLLSGRGGVPRAPTAPPTSQGPWKLPGAY